MSDFIGTKLTMNLGERSYDIILKNGALENLYQFARLDRKVAGWAVCISALFVFLRVYRMVTHTRFPRMFPCVIRKNRIK